MQRENWSTKSYSECIDAEIALRSVVLRYEFNMGISK
jgi:hypothetical protein